MYSSAVTQIMQLNLGIIAIQGEDAAKFLQGQVTCDVRELLASQDNCQPILLGGQCNVKGRLLLIFHAIQPKPDLILLFVNPELVDIGLANLRKYAVFFKVNLSDLTQEWRGFMISEPTIASGTSAKIELDKLLGSSPAQAHTWIHSGEHLLLQFTQGHYLVWLSTKSPNWVEQEANLIAHFQPAHQTWQSYLISQGVPDLYPITQELFTPQDVNLPLLGGVNFRKGCYTGQEIVARLHYKAKLKRHMHRFEMNAVSELPLAGSSLRDSQGKNVGEVVMAMQRDSSTIELLASINDQGVSDAFIEGNLQKLRQLPLPYAIPSENEEPNA